MLWKKTGDEDTLKMRLSTIIYSYKKANLWNEAIKENFETLLEEWNIGKVSGLETAISETEVKGKGELQEILEQTLE